MFTNEKWDNYRISSNENSLLKICMLQSLGDHQTSVLDFLSASFASERFFYIIFFIFFINIFTGPEI